MRCRIDRRGQELLEYALVLPLLLLLIFGIVDFGLAFFAYNSVANAAREGARAGVVPSATEDDIIDAAIGRTGGVALTTQNITVTRTISQTIVEVVYDYSLISGPIIQAAGGSPVLQLRSVATMRNE
ncbi:MAG: pilus assembly protein [Anaerolineae bacterium]|jgi:Flp pilus assembly protein TadG